MAESSYGCTHSEELSERAGLPRALPKYEQRDLGKHGENGAAAGGSGVKVPYDCRRRACSSSAGFPKMHAMLDGNSPVPFSERNKREKERIDSRAR